MDFSFSEEQQLIQDSINKFIQNDYDFETRMAISRRDIGYSKENWELFAELGWLAIPFTEEQGGLGGSAIDLMVVMEEFGKGILVEPFIPTVIIGGGLLSELGNEEQQALIDEVVAGNLQLAFAHAEPGSRYRLNYVSTVASKSGDNYIINGEKSVVLNESADKFLVLARTYGGPADENGLSIFIVDANSDGVTRTGFQTIDGQRGAEIRLEDVNVPASAMLGKEGEAFEAVQKVMNRAILAVCSEAVGAMEVLLERTVEYSKTRKQFGVTLSTFQALQHRMADMFIQHQQARSIVLMAALEMDKSDDLTSVSKAISAAKAFIGKSSRHIGQEAIQIHGGIGVTEELDVGHFVKRVTVIEQLFGNTDYHTSRFAHA